MFEFDGSSVSIESVAEKLKEEYPDLSKEERYKLAQEVKEKVSEGFASISDEKWKEIAEEARKDIREAGRGDDFELDSEIGTYGVMIMSSRDERTCNPCLDHDGTTYTLDEAKEQEPLPHGSCENEECRCIYMPIPDRETFERNKREEPDLSNLYD